MFSLSNSDCRDFSFSSNLACFWKSSWNCFSSNFALIPLRETDEELGVLLLDCELLKFTLLLDERIHLDGKEFVYSLFCEV